MGIQINGNTDTISAIDGGLNVSGASLGSASASSLNISGIVTASGFSGNVTGNVTGNINSSGVSTFSGGGLLVGTGASISSPATNVLALGTNNTEHFRIDSSGRIQHSNSYNTEWGAGFISHYSQSITNIYFRPSGQYTSSLGLTGNTNTTQFISIDSSYNQTSSVSAGIFLSAFHADAGGSACGFTLKNLRTDAAGLVFSSVFTGSNGSNATETERLRIDSSGRVTMPYQPAFFARPPGGYDIVAGGNIIGGTWVESYDRTNSFSNGTFTAPVSGWYCLNWNVFLTSETTRQDAYILVNGSEIIREEINGYTGTFNRSVSVHGSYQLAANDAVTFGVYSSAGVTLYTSQNPWGYASGFLVG